MADILEEDVKEEVVEDAASTAPDYKIDYTDSRFSDVEAAKKDALSEVDKTYDGMLEQSDQFYNNQIDAAKEWEKKQTELQNEQTEFTIGQIEQQKEQEEKDYQKEQSGAYVDWQKQSNQYGANKEKEAAQGMSGSGYSESAQVSMYNTYQQRITAARESFRTAIQNFNNSITQARLQNNSALAQIAYQSLQTQLELALSGFQYKNQLLLEKASQKLTVENNYYNRWADVLAQMNTENALAENIRQYNESLAEEQRQFNFYNKLGEFAEEESSGGGDGGSSSSSKKTSNNKIDKDSGSGTDTAPHYKGWSNMDKANAGIANYESKGVTSGQNLNGNDEKLMLAQMEQRESTNTAKAAPKATAADLMWRRNS